MKKKGKWFWLFIGSSVIAIVLFAWTVFSATTFIQYAGALEKTENAYNKLNKKYKKLKKENSDAVNGLSDLFSDDDSEDDDDIPSTTWNIGDTVEFKSGEKVTVTAIKDSTMGLIDSHTGTKAVDAYVTVENTTNQPLDFNVQNFTIYDSNDENGEFDANTYEQDIPNSIAAGKKASIYVHFAVKTGGPYSVTFGDVTWEQ